jgi:hypothetical protein
VKRDSDLEPELEALVRRGWIRRRAPDRLRARVDARARAFMAEGESERASPVTGSVPLLPRAATVRSARRYWTTRFALAASIAFAAGAAGAVTTVFVRSRSHPQAQPPPRPMRVVAPRSPIASPAADSQSEPPAAVPPPAAEPRPHRRARSGAGQDPYVAEVALLQRAHAAYERRDFSSALGLMEEHRRRFPEGRLAEEREALRVRTLARSGRTADARRAAAAFAVRFPRSVFLPRIREAVGPSQ